MRFNRQNEMEEDQQTNNYKPKGVAIFTRCGNCRFTVRGFML